MNLNNIIQQNFSIMMGFCKRIQVAFDAKWTLASQVFHVDVKKKKKKISNEFVFAFEIYHLSIVMYFGAFQA